MKKILLILLAFSCAFSAKLRLANAYEDLSPLCAKTAKDLDMTLFSPSKIYKDNGALLGLIHARIDLALLRRDFLSGGFDDEFLQARGFWILASGKTYILLAASTLKPKLAKEKLEKLKTLMKDLP